MKSKDIKSVSYYLRGEKIVDIEYLRYVSFFDVNISRHHVHSAEWLEVLVRGDMMLYLIQETSQSRRRKSYVNHYLVKKDDEEYATEIAYVRYKNGFLIYRMEAGNYFADVPEIERKIENREEGFAAKDIINIVTEYNNFRKTTPKP